MTEVVLDRLCRRFGSTLALDAVSMRIEQGSFVSILGPSGCGKSTTLRLIAGFDRCDSGQILFGDEDVAGLPPERRNIGMVFQSYALFPHMTVAQNVAFGLQMRHVAKSETLERVRRVLELVRLDGRADRYPAQLSGGQQQRVALARALVIEPRILLLDEPLANLDATLREEMRVFIRDLQRRVGITTIYVTHDQAEAMALSDQVVVMFGGKVAQTGAPQEIYAKPVTSDVARFIGKANFLDARLRMANGRPHADTPLGLLPLHPDAPPRLDAFRGIVRPEQLAIRSPDAPGAVSAVVEVVQFGGHLTDYRLTLSQGGELDIQIPGPPRFALGDRVAVGLNEGWLWPVAREGVAS